MRSKIAFSAAALAAATLSGCGGDSAGTSTNTSATAGTLIESPPLRVASLNAADLGAELGATDAGKQLLALAGTPECGVDFHYFHYQTVGGKDEATTASGAIMAPTGTSAACSGPRPILLYAHGTSTSHAYNIAAITDQTNDAWQESAMIGAFYAAHGYIVVASNYAGYDSSPLPYHPYLNAKQQSSDLINALAAARTALKDGLPAGVTDNGKLFVTGYSQGGHVALATERALEAAGQTVTAAAPMSGPYSMLAVGDAAIAFSNPGLGGTVYYPLIINSYQQSYGNVYTALTDFYSPTYATGIDKLLPGPQTASDLFTAGKLPQFAIFDKTTPVTGVPQLDAALAVPDATTNPIAALGFGDPFLLTNALRVAYLQDAVATPDGLVPTPTALPLPPAATPAYGIRADLRLNDLRGYAPKAPTRLCGGMNDPEVFFRLNTQALQGIWAAQSLANVSAIDVDPTTNGDSTKAGQVAAKIGTIAATVYATEAAAGTATATILADVQKAIVADASFSAYFTGGVPNGAQGVMVLGLAAVGSQGLGHFLALGETDPTKLGTDVGNAVVSQYHFPLTQTACEVDAPGLLRPLPMTKRETTMQRKLSIASRLAPAALLLAGGLGSAHAQSAVPDRPNELRVGAYFVHYAAKADDLSGPFTPAGVNLEVHKITTMYLSYLRSLDANWTLEFAAGIPPTTHTYGKGPATVGSVPFNGEEVATAKWFSPSVLLDYKFLDATSALRPYVGIGMNFTKFYERKSTPAGDAANGGPTRVTLSNSFGPAATIGASYRFYDNFNVIASYSIARVNSHYVSDTAGAVRETHIHFNPRAFIVAAGYSF